MKKSKFKLKTFVFSLAMAANFIMPLSVQGQNSRADAFFRSEIEEYEFRDGSSFALWVGLFNDPFEAPLDGGLLIMTAAGVVYAFRKKSRVMRRFLMSFIVVALILGFTQCRKNNKEVIHYDKKAFNITLNVDGGAKTNVIPETGAVLFEEGDEILVANNGFYVGRLIYDGEAFIGTITNPDPCDYLHFYHLGNRDVGTLTEGSSTECFVSIADQTLSLPVISYGRSYGKFSPDYLAYTTRLRNKCALVKFDVSTMSRHAGTYIKDLNNIVHVDFAQSSFNYFKDWEGNITLPSGSGEKWAILLPQPEKEEGGLGSVFSGAYAGMRGIIPEIRENVCYPDGIPVNVERKTVPKGALEGLFSVDKNKRVHFAKGNLVYDKIRKMWRFFENQYEMLYTEETNVGVDYSETDMIEHFGWGTSGFNHGGVTYQPWITDGPNTNYYAYGDERKGLNAETGLADWGYNLVDNGGMAYRQWRTITAREMIFLLGRRENASDKYSFGSINDGKTVYNGLIILPDDWILPDGLRFLPAVVDNFIFNSYNVSDWALMEAAGAVFLPCSGHRYNDLCTYIQTHGFYWTGDAFDNNHSNCLLFESGRLTPARGDFRFIGMPVRLVIE